MLLRVLFVKTVLDLQPVHPFDFTYSGPLLATASYSNIEPSVSSVEVARFSTKAKQNYPAAAQKKKEKVFDKLFASIYIYLLNKITAGICVF